MIRRILARPLQSLLLMLLWLLITDAASLALVLLGGLLALIVPWLTQAFWPAPPRLLRPGLALRFLLVFACDIVTANWRVGRQVVGPVSRLSPALVEVPLELRDPFVATLLASVVSLTPGTVAIDLDREAWILLVHALDAPDPPALVKEIKQRYELPLREIFAC